MENTNENEILNAFVEGANAETSENSETANKVTFAEVSEQCKQTADILGNFLLDTDNVLSSQKLNQLLKLRRMLLNFRAEN